jgi:hypothetical protein
VEALRAWLDEHPPQKRHAQDAIVGVVTRLRTYGELSTAELRAPIYEAHAPPDYGGDAKAYWSSIQRYFDAIPGIDDPEVGRWAYAGDAARWAALQDDSGAPDGWC